MKRTAFIRADGGGRMGWGHLVRTSALAEGLRRAGWRVVYLVLKSDASAVRMLKRRFEVVRLTRELGKKSLPSAFGPGAWVIVDRYGIGADRQAAIKASGARLLCIDDLNETRFHADVVVNGHLGAERMRYAADPATRLLLGGKYSLLRPEFQRAPRVRRFPARAKRVLVTFGGSDPLGLCARICRILSGLPLNLGVTALVGLSAPSRRPGPGVTVIQGASASEMRRQMEKADAVVAAPGVTCLELARLGVPTAVMPYVDNQKETGRRLAGAGMVLDLGWYKDATDAAIGRKLETFLRSEAARRRMSRRFRRAVDGRGVERVIQAMRTR